MAFDTGPVSAKDSGASPIDTNVVDVVDLPCLGDDEDPVAEQ
jgi:hypothetical protein